MEQKLIQIGNSAGVIIPQELRREIGVKPGDKVIVQKKGSQIVISSAKKRLAGGVDSKFMKMVDEFIDEHEDVLTELAKR